MVINQNYFKSLVFSEILLLFLQLEKSFRLLPNCCPYTHTHNDQDSVGEGKKSEDTCVFLVVE
jgi:hypothetical protein